MSVGRDSTYLFLTNIAQAALSLLTGVLAARLLGPEGKGELYMVTQFASMASLILGAGLGPSYQFHLSKQLLGRHEVLGHFWVQLGLVAVVVAGLFWRGDAVLSFVTSALLPRQLMLLACIATVLNVAVLYLSCMLMTLPNGILSSSVLGLIGSITNIGCLVFFVRRMQMGAAGGAVAFLLSLAFPRLIVMLLLVSRGVWTSIRLRWLSASKLLLPFGAGAFLFNVMVSSVFRVDVFIVGHYRGAADVGTYSVAVALAEVILMAPSAVGTALFAHLPSMPAEKQIEVVGKSARLTALLAISVGVAVVIFSYPAVVLLMGRRFAPAVLPLCLLVPGLVAMSVNYIFANYVAAMGTPVISAGCFAVGLVANVLIDLWIVPSGGIAAAAIGSSVAYVLITVAFLIRMHRADAIPIRELIVVRGEDFTALKARLLSFARRSQSR